MTAPVRFSDNCYAAGQPTREQLADFARDGVRTVINLRGPTEVADFDEAKEAVRLGLQYVSLPITGPGDLDRERVRAFGQALDQARRDGGVLIHCATANRVGAMVALDELLNRNATLDAALERGRAAGLGSLEPAVVAVAERERVSP